jgi:hypothetical protein
LTSRTNDRVDAGVGGRPPALLGHDQLPAASVKHGSRRVDRYLDLTRRGGRLSRGRVDRLVADEEEVPPGAPADASRPTISSTEPAMWT